MRPLLGLGGTSMKLQTISRLTIVGRTSLAIAATALLATSVSAHEGDHWPIATDQLKMSYDASGARTKFSFKATHQVNINPVSLSEDPTTERSTLLVRGSGDFAGTSELIELDPARWSRIGSEANPQGWQFNGSEYFTQGIKKIQIKSGNKDGSLQIQAKGFYWPFTILGPQDSVEIVLTIGEFAFCGEVSADRNAEMKSNEEGSISARYSLAPAECPQVCGNGVLETGEACDDGNLIDNDTCSNICVGCDPGGAEFASTFEGIQSLIFDNPAYSCSNDTCHGSGQAGNLDLRAGASHDALVGVASSIAPGTQRVFPGDQDLSLLYNKIANKTLGSPNVPGSGMPVGGTVSEDHLAALRLWIRGGASQTGVVAGTAELLGSCLPAPTPLDIPQPPVPDPSVGTQFAMPGFPLLSDTETEGCVATYYDLSATVPPSMMVDCAGAFPGTNETGPYAGKCFTYNTNNLYQDAQSHHSIVHIYPGQHTWTDPGWGNWSCYEGTTPGATCDPTVANVCGTGGVCGSKFHKSTACLPSLAEGDWGAPDFDSSSSPQFSGSQESTASATGPAGVYFTLPVKGLIVWNSHAFNLTTQNATMNGWINVEYTADRQWPARGLFASQYIFTQNVPPFEQREYCATYTFPANAHLFQLSSHTHKRGIRWRYYDAPQTPCGGSGGNTSPSCTPGPGTPFYESYDYSDAVNMKFDPPKVFVGSSPADRTIKYCSLYDNGQENPDTVKTQSGSPSTSGNFFLGGPCSDAETYCNDGINKGQLCYGNNNNCPGSVCDACTLRGGTTTEDEMFIALGTFYIP